jgi:hypothetical protein
VGLAAFEMVVSLVWVYVRLVAARVALIVRMVTAKTDICGRHIDEIEPIREQCLCHLSMLRSAACGPGRL